MFIFVALIFGYASDLIDIKRLIHIKCSILIAPSKYLEKYVKYEKMFQTKAERF